MVLVAGCISATDTQRSTILSGVSRRYGWDDFVLDLNAYRLERGGQLLPLEPKALDLLALMVRQPQHLFTKQQIFDTLWRDTAVTDHALTRVVSQLRRALGDEARDARYLETVPTRGYRWVYPVVELDAPPGHLQVSPTQARDSAVPLPPTPPPAATEPPTPAVADRQEVPRTLAIDQTLPPEAPPSPTRSRRQVSVRAAAVLALAMLAGLAWVWTTNRGETAASRTMMADREPPVPGPTPHGVQWPRQATTDPGLEMHPAVSPKADAMAFTSARSGSFEIYVRALTEGAADVALTSDSGENVQPAWSPDGTRLAFHSARNGGIWVIPSRGGVARQIVPTGSRPAWSPDGGRIAFQSDEHLDASPVGFDAQSGSTIWIANADGSDPRPATRAGAPIGGHAAPAWSPDGRFLAFAVFDGLTDNGIWLVDVASGKHRRLAEGQSLFEPEFAPDGSALYVSGGVAVLLRIPFDASSGTVAGPLVGIPVPGVPGVRGVSLWPDGNRIAFAGLSLTSQLWAQPLVAGAPRGAPVALTSDTGRRTSWPAMSPDGSRIAYTSARHGEPTQIWVMSADGQNQMQLTSNGAANDRPRWLPGGTRVAYFSMREDAPGLWASDVQTRREERFFDIQQPPLSSPFAPLLARAAEFDVSRHATQLAFSVMLPPSGARVIHVATLDDAFTVRRLTDPSQWVGYPAWSVDDRSLAVEIKDGSSTHAAVVDVASGAIRQLTSARGQTWVRSWSPDNRRIAAAVQREGRWSLRWVAADGSGDGELLPPVPAGTYVRYPEWAPRGDRLVFERAEMRGDVWTLDLK